MMAAPSPSGTSHGASGWAEAAQDQLDDARGEAIVDGAAGDQQPVEEGPAEHVQRELEVEIGAQVAPLDAALEHGAKRRPSPGKEALASGAGEFGDLGGWPRPGLASPRPRPGCGRPRPRRASTPAGPSCVEPVSGTWISLTRAATRGREQLVLRTVTPVDRGLPNARAVGHFVHAQIANTTLSDELEHGFDDAAIRARLPRSSEWSYLIPALCHDAPFLTELLVPQSTR